MVSYYLGQIANAILDVAWFFHDMAIAIFNVPILGPNLYVWFIQIHLEITIWSLRAYDLQDAWDEFEANLSDGFSLPWQLSDLIPWAAGLIEFIIHPWNTIADQITANVPWFWDVLDDPITFVRNQVYNVLDEIGDIIGDIEDKIRSYLYSAVIDFDLFIFNASAWVVDRLREYNIDLADLLDHPLAYFRAMLHDELSEVFTFLDNPFDYIMPRIIEGLEDALDKYKDGLISITTKILNKIF